MQGELDQSIRMGPCEVTVSGPLQSVVPLLEHLQAFATDLPSSVAGAPYSPGPSLPSQGPVPLLSVAAAAPASSTPRTPPRFPSAAPLRTLARPEVTLARSVPVAQDHLQGKKPRATGSPSRQELASTLPPCPPAWLDRAPSSALLELRARAMPQLVFSDGTWFSLRCKMHPATATCGSQKEKNAADHAYLVIGRPLGARFGPCA